MKTLLSRLGLVVLIQATWLCPSAQAAQKVWNNLSGGSWTNANNWTPAGVPAVADSVFITNNGTYRVSLDANATVASLTLGGVSGTQTLSNNASALTLNSASAVRNNGVLVMSGGTLSGSNGVTIVSGGELRLTGNGTKYFTSLRLLNQGTVRWLEGTLQSEFNAPLTVVTNAGLWLAESDFLIYYPYGGPQPQFHNTGTFRKSAGAGTTAFNAWLFSNTGTVDVQTGTLAFDNAGGLIAGQWLAAAATTIRFNSGAYTNAAGATFTGPGTSRFLGTTLVLTGAGAPIGLRLEGGTVLPAAGFQGGTITNLTVHGSTLLTTGAVNTVTGSLVASNGTFSGLLTIAPGAQLILAGNGTKYFTSLRLLNQGTVRWLEGTLQSEFNAPLTVVTNAGLWLAESDFLIYYPYGGPQPQFHNTGTFRKSAGAGTTAFNAWLFSNTGTVDVQTGTLAFDNAGGLIAGQWLAAAATTIRFNSGAYTNAAGATFTGPGTSRFLGTTLVLTGAGAPIGLRLEGGTVLPAAGFQGGTITNLTVHGSTLLTTGAVNTVTGSLVASNGTFSGLLTIAPGAQLILAGNGTKYFTSLRLLNQGTVRWLEGTLQSEFNAPLTVVTNAGLWLAESDFLIYYPYGGPQPQFHNTGTFRKSAGAGTTAFNAWLFSNTGTVDVQTGTLAFDNAGGLIAGQWLAAAATTIRFNSGAYTNAAGATFTGPGTSRFLGTTLVLTGAGAPIGLRLEGGTVLPAAGFQGGTITNLTVHGSTLLTTGAVNTVTGSLVASNGTFSGLLTIAPGAQLILAGNGTKYFTSLRLLNQGTVRWLEGTLQSEFNAPLTVVTNAGLWLAESDFLIYYPYGGPQPQFHNTGTFRKSAGAGTTAFNAWLFSNTGTVDVQTGTLAFDNAGGLIAGQWLAAAATTIRFNSGAYTNAAGATFTGPGTSRFLGTTLVLTGAGAPIGLRLEGGTVLPAAGFQGGTITNLTVHGSTLLTTGAVNTVTGSLVASNGTFSGLLTIAPGAQLILAGNGTKYFTAVRLLNQGTVRWLEGTLQSEFNAPLTVVTNAGLWLAESDFLIYYPYGGPQPQFHNTGTFRKSAGAGTTAFNAWLFSNTGTVDVQAGTLAFTTPPSLTSGLIHLANANLNFSQPQLIGGRLQGRGTITGTVTNAGVIAPTNTGTITITGNYYQDTSSGPRLEFSLGGTLAGTNHSLLRVNGTANTGNPILDGSLVVKLVTGFSPALSSRFDVLIAGTLAAGPAANIISGPATFQVQTNATRLSLVTTATGPAQPALTVVRNGGGVRVSWPATPGYVLQSTTNLNTVPASWINVPGSPNPYNTPGTDPQRFFRLIRP